MVRNGKLSIQNIVKYLVVPAKKIKGEIQFCPNFIDDRPNHNLVTIHGVDKTPHIFV